MGAVSFSIDVDLIRFFKRYLPLAAFIETGTMKGDTVALVRPYFARTVSIELSDDYYQAALERFRGDPDVILLKGDSAALIEGPAREADAAPAMFWLDAHWCRDDEEKTEGAGSQCPLLGEIRAIGRIHPESVLLVDDARLFLCTPGRPHDYGQWPDFHDIVTALLALSPVHRVMVVNDVIVFYPEALFAPFRQFVHETGVDWLEIANTHRDRPRLSRECETLARAREELARTHQETARELAELRRSCDEERRQREAERREAAAALSARERIEQEFERNRALMEVVIAQKDAAIVQLESIAGMQRQTIAQRDQVIQRLESRRFFKRAVLWAAGVCRRNP